MPIRLVLGALDRRVTDLTQQERRLSRAFDGRWGLIGAAGEPSKSDLFPGVAARLHSGKDQSGLRSFQWLRPVCGTPGRTVERVAKSTGVAR